MNFGPLTEWPKDESGEYENGPIELVGKMNSQDGFDDRCILTFFCDSNPGYALTAVESISAGGITEATAQRYYPIKETKDRRIIEIFF